MAGQIIREKILEIKQIEKEEEKKAEEEES